MQLSNDHNSPVIFGEKALLIMLWRIIDLCFVDLQPESLTFSKTENCFSFQWSFGIVLWELLTRGVTPYPDVEPQNIKNYLNGGKRLKKPRQCPETL